MTIAICLKVGDGVVLGTDSAASLIGENERYFNVYFSAEKTINLVKGMPIGMMTYGLGGLAGLSIGSLARDLRQRLSGEDKEHLDWTLDRASYTIEGVAKRVREFFYDELYTATFGSPPPPSAAPSEGDSTATAGQLVPGEDAATAGAGAVGTSPPEKGIPQGEKIAGEGETAPVGSGEGLEEEPTSGAPAPKFPVLGFVIAGFSASSYYAEVWTVETDSTGHCHGPTLKFGPHAAGVSEFWGMPEALYRLVYGWSQETHDRLVASGLPPDVADQLLISRTDLAHPGMPMQDAIDLVQYMADVTVGYVRFKVGAPSVAPPIDIAAITRHQGFKWVARKHFYEADLNPTSG